MADYKDKIRKLLALAQSPEEAEAKAALNINTIFDWEAALDGDLR